MRFFATNEDHLLQITHVWAAHYWSTVSDWNIYFALISAGRHHASEFYSTIIHWEFVCWCESQWKGGCLQIVSLSGFQAAKLFFFTPKIKNSTFFHQPFLSLRDANWAMIPENKSPKLTFYWFLKRASGNWLIYLVPLPTTHCSPYQFHWIYFCHRSTTQRSNPFLKIPHNIAP